MSGVPIAFNARGGARTLNGGPRWRMGGLGLWVVLFWGGLGVWGLFCVGWPKKCWMGRRGVACVSDTQDSFSYVDLDLAPGLH